MNVSVVTIGDRSRGSLTHGLAADYERRLQRHAPVISEQLPSESRLIEKSTVPGRTRPILVLLDSRGRLLSSEELARWIGKQRDGGAQHLIFAVGPADGWSEAARRRADLLLSFGPMTFPHELARVMLAEQLYRAFTILAGHPYHCGH